MRRILAVVCGAALVASCSDVSVTGQGDHAVLQRSAVVPSTPPCAGCVVNRVFVRAVGAPPAELVVFPGDAATDYVLDIDDGGSQGANATVRLNGAAIVTPGSIAGQSRFHVRRPAQMAAINTLEVRLTGKPGSFLIVQIVAGIREIGPAGGSVSASGIARLDFPSSFFAQASEVEISRTLDAPSSANFAELKGLFRVGAEATHLVRVLVGSTPSDASTLRASFIVPSELDIPTGQSPNLFGRIYETGGQETLDNFQVLPSAWDPLSRQLTADIPAWTFNNARRDDGRFEALFAVATTPGGVSTGSPQPDLLPVFNASAVCHTRSMSGDPVATAMISRPLPADFLVSQSFGLNPSPFPPFLPTPHFGADFGVQSLTPVLAASSGFVETIHTQTDPAGGVTGYGLYMVLRHADGAATLYAHLNSVLVPMNATVSTGMPIAYSDNSGTSTGPHLHFEYVPSGAIIKSPGRVDPIPCLTPVPSTSLAFYSASPTAVFRIDRSSGSSSMIAQLPQFGTSSVAAWIDGTVFVAQGGSPSNAPQLLKVDPANGTTTTISQGSTFGAMVKDPAQNALLVVGSNRTFLSVSPTTGATTQLATFSLGFATSPFAFIRDLAVTADGTLFGFVWDPGNPMAGVAARGWLVRVDRATFTITTIGSAGSLFLTGLTEAGNELVGLACDQNGSRLVSVDRASGSVQQIIAVTAPDPCLVGLASLGTP